MTKAHDHYGDTPKNDGVADLPMFAAQPAFTERWDSLTDERRKAQRERWCVLLKPLVLQLAVRRGAEGITASEVISEGIVAGVLNGERTFLSAHPRVYSFVGAWLAGLARSGVLKPKTVPLPDGGVLHLKRKSLRHASHANEGHVYVAAA